MIKKWWEGRRNGNEGREANPTEWRGGGRYWLRREGGRRKKRRVGCYRSVVCPGEEVKATLSRWQQLRSFTTSLLFSRQMIGWKWNRKSLLYELWTERTKDIQETEQLRDRIVASNKRKKRKHKENRYKSSSPKSTICNQSVVTVWGMLCC